MKIKKNLLLIGKVVCIIFCIICFIIPIIEGCTIDWISYDELSEKGYFSDNTPPWVSFLGYLEVVGDVVQDKILSADYKIKTIWTDYRTKILE